MEGRPNFIKISIVNSTVNLLWTEIHTCSPLIKSSLTLSHGFSLFEPHRLNL